MSIQITWYGHSCFAVEAEDYRIVLDPYADASVPGLPNLRLTANEVLCSHEHDDHHGVSSVKVNRRDTIPFSIQKYAVFHDPEQGRLRGSNTIHRITCQGMSIVHLGDLGHLLSENTAKQVEKPDLLLIPVGGYYTIDAEEAAQTVQQLKPGIVIPMHYRQGAAGYSTIGTVEPFLKHFGAWERLSAPLILEKTDTMKVAVFDAYSAAADF